MANNTNEGKMPYDIEAERQLICAVCDAPDVAPSICDTLAPEDFYDDDNAAIFRHLYETVKRGAVADVYAVVAQCRNNGDENAAAVLRAFYAAQTNSSTFASLNAPRYAEIVKDCAIRRRALRALQRYAAAFSDMTADTAESTAGLLKDVCNISTATGTTAPTSFAEAVGRMLQRMEANRNGQRLNVATLESIDRYTGGFQFGELEIIGAESGTGKTALALSIAKRAARVTRTPLLYFSSEMEAEKLAARLLSMDAQVAAGDIIAKPLDDYASANVKRAVEVLQSAIGELFKIEEHNKNGLAQIIASIRRAVARDGVKLVVVDYLQQFVANGPGENKEQATANFTRELKNVAQELQICVVVLSQLRKPADVNERPTLLRLRDSGQIAEAADNVIIIDRPEARPETACRKYAAPWTNYTTHETAVITFEKCRNAAPRSFLLGWSGPATAFYDIDTETKKEGTTKTNAPNFAF